jgi:hypothetical protein
MINQEKINEMEIEKETQELIDDKIFFSKEIIDIIKRSRYGIGCLTIENIAMCIHEAMGEDTEKLTEELTNRLK